MGRKVEEDLRRQVKTQDASLRAMTYESKELEWVFSLDGYDIQAYVPGSNNVYTITDLGNGFCCILYSDRNDIDNWLIGETVDVRSAMKFAENYEACGYYKALARRLSDGI